MAFHPLERFLAWQRTRERVAVYYHPAYAARALADTMRVPNVEPRRGELVLSELLEEKLITPEMVRPARPPSLADLARFHPTSYLERAEDPDVVGRVFGLEPSPNEADELVSASLYAVGGTIAAAEMAIAGADHIAVNLGGGFHHAERDRGAGFCLYNDIGVAIAKLRDDGFSAPIAIVDLDFHQGDGNMVAFAADPSVFCYSIHGSIFFHGPDSGRQIHLQGPVDDKRYLATLRSTLELALAPIAPGLVFYIAGTDILAGDRLGTFQVSLEGALLRDRLVLELCERLSTPVVVTLGGGYSKQSWVSSLAMLRYVLTGRARVSLPLEPNLRLNFERIRRQLDPLELQREDDDRILLTTGDLMSALSARPPATRLLDFYTPRGVELALERYGIMNHVRERGYGALDVSIDPADPSHQIIRVRGQKPDGPPLLLVEVVLRRTSVPDPTGTSALLAVLGIEWMLLQDPAASFSLARPPLPGQEHPGLGIAREVLELLIQACHRLGLVGILDQPAHLHNAGGPAGEFHFIDPKDEGTFHAMASVLSALPIEQASRLADEGALRLADGTVLRWQPRPHLLPIGPPLIGYFASEAYRMAAAAEVERLRAAGLQLVTDPLPVGQ